MYTSLASFAGSVKAHSCEVLLYFLWIFVFSPKNSTSARCFSVISLYGLTCLVTVHKISRLNLGLLTSLGDLWLLPAQNTTEISFFSLTWAQKPSPLGGKVAANAVSRRMRGNCPIAAACLRPHQSPAVTASPDRGKPLFGKLISMPECGFIPAFSSAGVPRWASAGGWAQGAGRWCTAA